MKRHFIFLLMFSFSLAMNAQLVINEFMAGNTSTVQDENSEYDDWIELYNTSDASVSLNGFYITDDFNNKLKFKLSSTLSVPAKGYLVVFADDNVNQGSLHANFKLSMDGEEIAIYKLSGTDTLLIDSLTFQIQSNDISYGRFPDGGDYFEFFTKSTPGAANNSGNLEGIAPMPVFSIPGGFYTGSQIVEITSGLVGAQIRYTTDGSEPDTASKIYSVAISFDTTLIIKAKVYAESYLPGKTQSYTYFMDEHFIAFNEDERLPVVSVSCNSEYLYDPSHGILIKYFENIEVPANIELYEPDGTNVINQGAGIRIYGNVSRYFEQKSILAYARSKYGKGSFDYKFFDDKPFEKYESFVMRNGGSDWSLSYFRDGLCQALIRNNMDIDAQGSKHAIMYLNGKFYGIIELKEKISEHYVGQNCNVNADNIDMLTHTGDGIEVICGDNLSYQEYSKFVANIDLSSPAVYSQLERKMDVKNFMNMQIAEAYISNIDVFNNIKFWREKETYGQWSWIVFDTEIGFGQEGDYSYTTDYGTGPSSNSLKLMTTTFGTNDWPWYRPWSSEGMVAILKNENFRNDYIQSFAVHINTTFKPIRVLNMIDSMQLRISKEIPYQIAKYGGHPVNFNPGGIHFSKVEEWEDHVDVMRDFAINRPDYMRSFIIDRFQLKGTYELVPTANDADKGKVFIQDIFVPFDSAGIYFDSIPLELKAIPNAGYKFSHWEGISGIDSLYPEISISLSENTAIKAVFAEEGNVLITEILYKTSTINSEFIEIKNPKHVSTIELSKYSLSGDITFTFPDSTFIAPGEYIAIAANKNMNNSAYTNVYQWTSGSLNDTVGRIILKDSMELIIDSIEYANESPWPFVTENNSIELTSVVLDNNTGNNWRVGITPGGSAGIPLYTNAIKSIKINEFMADNGNILADNEGECNDWIEILNPTDEEIDFGGIYITNDLTKTAMYQVPLNAPEETTIKPGEYKILWADNDTEQGPLHLGFKLSASGGEIGLSADGRSIFESVNYSQQLTNFSLGRHFDGTGTWETYKSSSPGIKNSYAPEFTSTPGLWCQLGEEYEYNISVADPEGDDLLLGIYGKPYWTSFTNYGAGKATIKGTMPGGVAKSFGVILFVTDGYTDPIFQEFTISRGVTPSGIFNESLATNQFLCYPNPTNGIFNVALTTGSPTVELSITNVTGQVVLIRKLNCQNEVDEVIDLSDQRKGIYYISIKAEEGRSTQKIIIY